MDVFLSVFSDVLGSSPRNEAVSIGTMQHRCTEWGCEPTRVAFTTSLITWRPCRSALSAMQTHLEKASILNNTRVHLTKAVNPISILPPPLGKAKSESRNRGRVHEVEIETSLGIRSLRAFTDGSNLSRREKQRYSLRLVGKLLSLEGIPGSLLSNIL